MKTQKDKPKISLIIVAYNEEKYIGDCLDYAIKNSQGKLHEIIVVDNVCTDNTKAEALKRPNVRVVREERKGMVRARQKGYMEAEGDILAYIDADTRMPEGWVHRVEKEFEKNTKLASISGPYRYHDGTLLQKIILNIIWWIFAPIAYRIAGYALLGGNFAIKKEVLDKMNGFDTNIEFYGEDTDIARRASKFGEVAFKIDFYIYSSSRRFGSEGLLKTNIKYAMNFISEVLIKRPVNKEYKDIR